MKRHSIRWHVIPTLFAIFGLAELGMARITERSWTYQEMFAKSDFVVIATGITNKDTAERSRLLKDIDVIGVETEFKTCLVVKGSDNVKNFILHHYRMRDGEFWSDGPLLVEVVPGKHQTFLLFLIKEKDGRYAPVAGQTDPAGFCVLELKGAAADPADLFDH